ncbi:hypothetical protein N798_13320 [Knoellia flava TL1]|uniref:Type II secretion system protein GspF domain-containing protein n=2 Tax=Knoellia flava TaxID=913969 RepID=A0A8H9FSL1_9MICO|nr:hypothetical protein [Knoellia flava]KGN29617.1 hypothetical protein N798_13320 [Knoellia flava TL1]GGB75857.1 hypothetical protein GCM10011314_14270 [Knoellia flava]
MTVLAGVLVVLAFVVWPARRSVVRDSVVRASVVRASPAGHSVVLDPSGRAGGVEVAIGPAGGSATGAAEGIGVAGRPTSLRERVGRLLQREVRLGRARQGWTADFAELAAVGLDAGLPSSQAAVLACAVGSTSRFEMQVLAARLAAAEAEGGPVGDCLARCADDDPDLRFLAAAWQLTDEFGVAAAPAARTAAGVLRERAAADERRHVLEAGPRASMWLLTLMPLSGPVVALMLGLRVEEVYGGAAAFASTMTGLLLTGAGWLWSRRLLRRAVRPARVR